MKKWIVMTLILSAALTFIGCSCQTGKVPAATATPTASLHATTEPTLTPTQRPTTSATNGANATGSERPDTSTSPENTDKP